MLFKPTWSIWKRQLMTNFFNSENYNKCAVTQCFDNVTGLNFNWKFCLKVIRIHNIKYLVCLNLHSETTVDCVGDDKSLNGTIAGEFQRKSLMQNQKKFQEQASTFSTTGKTFWAHVVLFVLILFSWATSGEAKKTILRYKAQSPNVTMNLPVLLLPFLWKWKQHRRKILYLPLFENTLEGRNFCVWVFKEEAETWWYL